jgi:hypothetical protein
LIIGGAIVKKKNLNGFIITIIIIIIIIIIGCLVIICSGNNDYKVEKVHNTSEKVVIDDNKSDKLQSENFGKIKAVTNEEIFNFEYDGVPKEYDWVKVWIEYYEPGKSKRELFSIKSIANPSGEISCNFENKDNKLMLRVNGLSGSMDKIIVNVSKKNTNTIVIEDNSEFLLGVKIKTNLDIPIISNEIFTNNEFDYTEIMKCNQVYLIKGKFY